MCLDGTRRCNVIEMAHATEERNVLRSFRNNASHVDEVVRETEIEIVSLVNLRHVLGSELKAESVDVGLEIGNFVTADRWEHVWGLRQRLVHLSYVSEGLNDLYLVQRVCKCNSSDWNLVTLRSFI